MEVRPVEGRRIKKVILEKPREVWISGPEGSMVSRALKLIRR